MNSSVVLLNLLRISLGNSVEWKGEGSVDWKEVIGLARKQGVLAIAFDALEKVPTGSFVLLRIFCWSVLAG